MAVRRRRHHLDPEPRRRRPATTTTSDHRPTFYAPYPTLVSVGHTAAGEQWLLDLEHVGYLSLTGDTERCMDLARFIAAELAHNAWSDMVDVTLVGFGAEMTALNPERLTHTDHLDDGDRGGDPGLADDTAGRGRQPALRARRQVRTRHWRRCPAPHVTLISPTAARDGAARTCSSVLVDELRSQPGPLRRRRGRRRG